MSKSVRKPVYSSKLPKPIAPYSPAMLSNGFVFVSGQLGVDPKTGKLAGSTVEEQTRQALENAKLLLEEAGLTLKDVVKVTVYLANIADFERMNQVYKTYFTEATREDDSPGPATSQRCLGRDRAYSSGEELNQAST